MPASARYSSNKTGSASRQNPRGASCGGGSGASGGPGAPSGLRRTVELNQPTLSPLPPLSPPSSLGRRGKRGSQDRPPNGRRLANAQRHHSVLRALHLPSARAQRVAQNTPPGAGRRLRLLVPEPQGVLCLLAALGTERIGRARQAPFRRVAQVDQGILIPVCQQPARQVLSGAHRLVRNIGGVLAVAPEVVPIQVEAACLIVEDHACLWRRVLVDPLRAAIGFQPR